MEQTSCSCSCSMRMTPRLVRMVHILFLNDTILSSSCHIFKSLSGWRLQGAQESYWEDACPRGVQHALHTTQPTGQNLQLAARL